MPRKPLALLLLSIALITFLIQSGEMGTSDTDHRLQVAHSWWTGDAEVAPEEYPEFGLHGRNGKLYAWYGIGQSLIFFPADIIASQVEKLPVFSQYAESGASPTIRTILISFSINILINVLTGFFAFQLLRLMGFADLGSTLGTLALLCGTTHFYYAQNMQENNYIFLLTLIGLYYQSRWAISYLSDGERKSPNRNQTRDLILGSAALGLNLLTRLTTVLDIAFAGVMVLLILLEDKGRAQLWRGLLQYAKAAAPVYAVFFFFDRLFQYVRFGSWTNTYVSIFAADQRRLDPSLPSTFPFNGHWFQGGLGSGGLGPLFSPSKSIFLFDPLLLLSLVVVVYLWPRIGPVLRSFSIASVLLVLGYIAFYARYFWWSGDFSWGDRYVSSAVEFACLLGVPLLAKFWRQIPPVARVCGAILAGISVLLQLISIAFWLPLEVYQTWGQYPVWIQWLRIKNVLVQFIVQFGGQPPTWAPPPPTTDDAWDMMHITTWNLLPSLLRHTGETPMWVVYSLEALWALVAIFAIFVLNRLFRTLSRTAA